MDTGTSLNLTYSALAGDYLTVIIRLVVTGKQFVKIWYVKSGGSLANVTKKDIIKWNTYKYFGLL